MKTYEIFTTTGSVIGQGNNVVEAIENAGNPDDIISIGIADTLPSTAPVDGGLRWVKASEIDGHFMVNGSKERFKELEHKGLDWKSFYNGWMEGRADFYMKLHSSPLPVQQQPTPTQEVVSAEEQALILFPKSEDDFTDIVNEGHRKDWVDGANWQANQPSQPIVGYTSEEIIEYEAKKWFKEKHGICMKGLDEDDFTGFIKHIYSIININPIDEIPMPTPVTTVSSSDNSVKESLETMLRQSIINGG